MDFGNCGDDHNARWITATYLQANWSTNNPTFDATKQVITCRMNRHNLFVLIHHPYLHHKSVPAHRNHRQPSRQPTSHPSTPTGQPSGRPSQQPTSQPTAVPTLQPVKETEYGLIIAVTSITGMVFFFMLFTLLDGIFRASLTEEQKKKACLQYIIDYWGYRYQPLPRREKTDNTPVDRGDDDDNDDAENVPTAAEFTG